MEASSGEVAEPRDVGLAPRRRAFADALWRLADLVQAHDTRRSFRAQAFRRAAWSLDDLSPDLSETTDEMLAVAGIGPGIIRLIEEFRDGGRLAELESLDARYPKEVARLRRLPRMKPSILRATKGELGVETVADLRSAVDSGAVATVMGVGPTTLRMWGRILQLAPGPGWFPAHEAWVMARQAALHLTRHTGGSVTPAGSVRRMDEWVDAIDVVLVPRDEKTTRAFLESTAIARDVIAARSDGVGLVLHTGIAVDVHMSSQERQGSDLIRATGPPAHVAEILSAGEEYPTEEEAYRAIGRSWVPPAARELPAFDADDVVRLRDMRGDLHLHSESSPDGRMDLEGLFGAAVEAGYEYVLVTDHTTGLRFGGLDAADIRRQAETIQRMRPMFPDLLVLHGAELNIGAEGELDLDDETLSMLDMAVAGVHSRFDLPRDRQMHRIRTALEHPAVRVLSHPTGRRIGIRPPLDVDLIELAEAAARWGVALEVNGHRDRLDLSAHSIRQVAATGVLLAADSDAHRFDELSNLGNAVATMQKAGVRPHQVVNALDVDAFQAWIASPVG